MNRIEGKVVAKENVRIGIVAARFNHFIVQRLIDGAEDGLLRHDVKPENIDLALVPGAFEIPVAAEKMAAVMQDNLNGQITILKSQLQELAISFGDALMPAVRKVFSVPPRNFLFLQI